MLSRPKLIAYYLPQFYPFPENDKWWGPGFTEWHIVAAARQLFRGHEQPRLPGELGFYDLRLEETRIAQAKLAKTYGIYGFCYWHYWMGDGLTLMNRPIFEVLNTKKPDFPFCLGWANHSWIAKFYGRKNDMLAEQKYPGKQDNEKHFYYNLPFFLDQRYIKVNDQPVYVIYKPKEIPNCKAFVEQFKNLAQKNGLKGLFVIGESVNLDEKEKYGLDAVTYTRHRVIESANKSNFLLNKIIRGYNLYLRSLTVFEYKEAMKYFLKHPIYDELEYPTIITGWDTTPRLGRNATILKNYSPKIFQKHVNEVLNSVKLKKHENNIIFVKSWNEWGEGNYLEPDQKYGRQFLQVILDEINEF